MITFTNYYNTIIIQSFNTSFIIYLQFIIHKIVILIQTIRRESHNKSSSGINDDLIILTSYQYNQKHQADNTDIEVKSNVISEYIRQDENNITEEII